MKRLVPGVPIVALGVPDVEGDVLACAEAGIAGYVTREASLEELVAVVRSAVQGELRCSPRIAAGLLRRLSALSEHGPSAPRVRLTARQREIVRLIGQDLSNKEIAHRLGIEVATVKNHVHNLLEKLNVHRRTAAVRLLGDQP
jgi:DNA-binding NarL/FixJ family response regulator